MLHLADRHSRGSVGSVSLVVAVIRVGDEVVNAENHTAICGEEEPAYRRCKVEYAQREREREREREAQRISLLRMQQLQ
mgnify:CR=1 FL=1